jgi:hypothetical protein
MFATSANFARLTTGVVVKPVFSAAGSAEQSPVAVGEVYADVHGCADTFVTVSTAASAMVVSDSFEIMYSLLSVPKREERVGENLLPELFFYWRFLRKTGIFSGIIHA